MTDIQRRATRHMGCLRLDRRIPESQPLDRRVRPAGVRNRPKGGARCAVAGDPTGGRAADEDGAAGEYEIATRRIVADPFFRSKATAPAEKRPPGRRLRYSFRSALQVGPAIRSQIRPAGQEREGARQAAPAAQPINFERREQAFQRSMHACPDCAGSRVIRLWWNCNTSSRRSTGAVNELRPVSFLPCAICRAGTPERRPALPPACDQRGPTPVASRSATSNRASIRSRRTGSTNGSVSR